MDNTAILYKLWCEKCYYYTGLDSIWQNYAYKTCRRYDLIAYVPNYWQFELGDLEVGLISIYKGDLHNVKIEIFYQITKVITEDVCNYKPINIIYKDWFFCLALEILGWLYIIVLETIAVEGILMMCVDRNIWQCHSIIGGISVDYED